MINFFQLSFVPDGKVAILNFANNLFVNIQLLVIVIQRQPFGIVEPN